MLITFQSFLPLLSFPLSRESRGINYSRKTDVIPSKVGNYKGIDSHFYGNWIPHPVRNDREDDLKGIANLNRGG